jgi:hypothetical protein
MPRRAPRRARVPRLERVERRAQLPRIDARANARLAARVAQREHELRDVARAVQLREEEERRRGEPDGRADEVAPTAVLLASDPGGNLYVGQTLGPNSGDVMP